MTSGIYGADGARSGEGIQGDSSAWELKRWLLSMQEACIEVHDCPKPDTKLGLDHLWYCWICYSVREIMCIRSPFSRG